jgi:hypothetical protein
VAFHGNIPRRHLAQAATSIASGFPLYRVLLDSRGLIRKCVKSAPNARSLSSLIVWYFRQNVVTHVN